MGFKIILKRQWRGRRDVLFEGIYRVPKDLPEGLAQQMIDAGAAEVYSSAPRMKAQPVKAETGPKFELVTADRRYEGQVVVVAASGPSLEKAVEKLEHSRGVPIIAVNDAYRLLPWAHMLYACDSVWWDVQGGVPDFPGEKWSSHTNDPRGRHNDKRAAAAAYGLKVIEGRPGRGFSEDPAAIHYGQNSGFQAVNLALLFGAAKVVLVGFDMRPVNGKTHFFGEHSPPLRNIASFDGFVRAFEEAVDSVPAGVQIVNATWGSAIKCFPKVKLDDALAASA